MVENQGRIMGPIGQVTPDSGAAGNTQQGTTWTLSAAGPNSSDALVAYYVCIPLTGGGSGKSLGHLSYTESLCSPPPNSGVKTLPPNVLVLGSVAFGR